LKLHFKPSVIKVTYC